MNSANENECSVCGTDPRASAICSSECEAFAVEQRAAMEQTECQDCGRVFAAGDMSVTDDGSICDACTDNRASFEEYRADCMKDDLLWEEGVQP